jgi:uncharacterized protein
MNMNRLIRLTLPMRTLRVLCAAASLSLLVACGTPAPPARLVHLRAATPVEAPVAAASSLTWQLMLPLRLPEYLDRDALLVPQGQAGLAPVPGHRWAEPLRESVPRLLRADLATLLGESRVWSSPLPTGLTVQRQLRIELLALESNAERTAVNLSARWSVVDVTGATPPRAASATLTVPVRVGEAGSEVDSLVAAHRLALWRLAERIVRP